MNTSLRDQLLQAGLVTEKQARQAAQQEQQRQFRDRPRPKVDSRPPGQGGGNRGGPRGGNPGGGAAQGSNKGSNQNAAPGAKGSAGQQPPSPKLQAQQAQAAKVARDQELNRRREDKAKRRARIAEIEQIIEQNRVPRLETEDYYSFIDGKKIRRMSVDGQRREQLTSGELAIVRYRGHYAVVPKAVAERIRERDENMVVPHVPPKAATEPDDAYKDFVVPDDLMW
jgi:uncharacterized protein YaiL (DUF2058 family)